jgi:hypothetical protein
MEAALAVFINGISGVFTGMAVLYLTIRLISVIAGKLEKKPGN